MDGSDLTLSNSATVRDNATNDLILTMNNFSGSVTVDTTALTMTIVVRDSNSNTIANTALTNKTSFNLLFTSNKDTTDFASDDIEVTNGTLSNFAADTDPNNKRDYTATLVSTGGGVIQLQLKLPQQNLQMQLEIIMKYHRLTLDQTIVLLQ